MRSTSTSKCTLPQRLVITLVEKIIYVAELKHGIRCYVSSDQCAYREGTNTTLARIKRQHMSRWLKLLDTGEADCVMAFAFDLSKAFNSVKFSKSTLFSGKLEGVRTYFECARSMVIVYTLYTTSSIV